VLMHCLRVPTLIESAFKEQPTYVPFEYIVVSLNAHFVPIQDVLMQLLILGNLTIE
jgi:hypothetical protein